MSKYQRLINDLNNDLESNNETLTIHFWSTDSFLEKMDPAQAEDWKEQFILNIIQKDKN